MNFKKNCNTSDDFEKVITCIDQKTFNLSEILEGARSGVKKEQATTDASLCSVSTNLTY